MELYKDSTQPIKARVEDLLARMTVEEKAAQLCGNLPGSFMKEGKVDRTALADLDDFTAEPIETALREAIVDGLEIKPRLAFGPVRVAVSGRQVSPPLFESLEILGKDAALARIDALAARLG